jgi:hypothetical protein
MSKVIRARFCVAAAMALAISAALASSAGAAPEVAYNNFNTVPATVNGLPNEDTYSQDSEGFPFGGLIETAPTNNRVLKSLTTQLDVFTCEHGVYYLENCFTLKPTKTFKQEWKAEIHAVGAGNTVGALVAVSTATLKLHFRPTTNILCPATSEGKGFGVNCDVGGFLQTVSFKKFTQTKPLPPTAIILLTSTCGACGGEPVNVGLQTAYKEYLTGEPEPFVSEPPAEGGVPATGSDPLPDDVYFGGTLESGWTNFQPVFTVTVK